VVAGMVVFAPMRARPESSTVAMILAVDMVDAQVRSDMKIDTTENR